MTPLLTVAQASRHLAIGKTTAYRYIEAGVLPAVKIGNCVRVEPQALDAFIKQHRMNGKKD